MKKHLPKLIFGAAILAAIIATALLYSGEEETGWFGYGEGEYVLVSLPSGGILEDLNVRRGDTVNANQLLFSLETTEEEAAVEEAEAALAREQAVRNNLLKGLRDSEIDALLAQKEQAIAERDLAAITLKRREELLLGGNTSQQSVDEARSAYERAVGRVDELEARIITARLPARDDEILAANAAVEKASAALQQAYYRLNKRKGYAPKPAFVFDTFYRVGEFVSASKGVVSLLPEENVKVRFFIPETNLGAVSLGQEIRILCDGCGNGVSARITYIAPDAEFTPPVIYSESARQKLVYMIEAYPLNPKDFPLKPGQPVEVEKP